jgi:DNA-binding response OmpR family regulator
VTARFLEKTMSKPLVFVIEDDPKLSQIFVLTLKADFEIEALTDGKAALARLAETVPALVILDLNLPGAPGKVILERIRADARFAKTHVILATADERQAEFLDADADIVLLKPVSPLQLREIAARFRQP